MRHFLKMQLVDNQRCNKFAFSHPHPQKKYLLFFLDFKRKIMYLCTCFKLYFIFAEPLRFDRPRRFRPVCGEVFLKPLEEMAKAKYDINQILLEIQEKEIFKINEVFLLFEVSADTLPKTDLRLIEIACTKQLIAQRNIYYNNLISEQKTFSKEFYATYLADIYDAGNLESESVKIEII